MKFLIYKVNNRKNKKNEGKKFSFDRLLFTSFIITFTLLIIVQSLFAAPFTYSIITNGNTLEGTPLGDEEVLYEEGEIVFRQYRGQANGQLKILVNGDLAAEFANETIKLNVKEGDIIEIDSSDVTHVTEVGVASKSENISSECMGRIILKNPGVKKLMQVKMYEK